MMIDNTLNSFNLWCDISDYESDETSVVLIDKFGHMVAEFNYPKFTKQDFDYYKIKNKTMYKNKHYVIDWDRVKTLDDVITILKELDLGFENPSDDMKKLCNYVDKSSVISIQNKINLD